MMKIACIHSQINIGGADRRLIDLANHLYKKGNDVYLYLMSNNNHNGYEIDPRIKVECIAKKSKIPKTQWISNVISLRKKLLVENIDLAISFLYPININLILATRGTKIKTIVSERGDPNKQPEKGVWKILRNWTYPMTDGIVFQTQGARQYYVDNLGLDGVVIHNPVDVGDVSATPTGNKVIANIGLLEPHKNQHRLICAFSIFSKTHPEYRLRICGGGELEAELKNYAESLKINDKIIWMGKIPDAYKVIAEDEFFVLSSDYEGMPNALMEAMAMGMPCISCDCVPGGARELIKDGENGLLCKLDKGEDLAKAMSRLADNNIYAKTLGYNASKLNSTHSSQDIYDRWMTYLEEVYKNEKKNFKKGN